MRKVFKKFSKTTGLHQVAASIQDQRRNLLRQLGMGSKEFKFNSELSFPIDIAARGAFRMFSDNDPDMRLEMECFIQLSKGKKCLLDIGSLFGIFSLTFTAINENGKAFAIEPSPKCYKTLGHNSKLNSDKPIYLSNIALGSEKGILDMHYEWVHLIANHENLETPRLQVEMTTLDHFVESSKIRPDIIKIDVDGYEGSVIAGAKNFLNNHDPLIFLELHGEWIQRYAYSSTSIAESLIAHNYHFFDLNLKSIEDFESAFAVFANRIICTKDPDIIKA